MKIDSEQPSAILQSADSVVVELVEDPHLGPDQQPHSAALHPTSPTGQPPEMLPPPLAPFTPATRRVVLIVGAIALVFFFLQISGVLDPFLWAIVVAYAFNPLVSTISRRSGLPRSAIIGIMYILVFVALAALVAAALPALNDQVAQFSRELPAITTDLQARYFGTQSQPLTILWFNIDVPQVTRTLVSSLNSALGSAFGGMFKVFSATISDITKLGLFLIVTFYLLVDAPKFGSYFGRAIPDRHRDEIFDLARRVDRCLSQYLRAEGLLILIMGVASFVVLSVIGVQFALVLAPIVGFLEIFPIIGPFAAITLVTLVALFSTSHFAWSHTTCALVTAVVFFIMRQIEDYAVIPHVIGHAVRLHPALILFAVAVGASVGGALGLFVAVPLTGALNVLGAYLYQKLDLN